MNRFITCVHEVLVPKLPAACLSTPLPARLLSACAMATRGKNWIDWCGSASKPTRTWGCLLMFDELGELYQQVILDHCKKPRNFHEMPTATCSAQGHNPLCGDQLKLFLTMDGDVIKDISFIGQGCCISKASASLLTEAAKGKTRADMQKTFEQVHEMVMTGKERGDVGKLAVFAGVYKFPARVKCAILSWHALISALKGAGNQPVTTGNEQN